MREKTALVISALCYLTILFAPFLFPIMVYLLAKDPDVLENAKKAIISHLVPVIAIPLGVTIICESAYSMTAIILSAVLFGILSLFVVIWNIVRGIKVLMR